MKSVILCEGFDDAWFLGYLIHKWSGEKWIRNPKEAISRNYSLPVQKENEKCEVYQRDSEKLAIWAVGGKGRLVEALGAINHINKHYSQDPLKNIVVVSDRDQDEITETLSLFGQNLTTDSKNTVTYKTNGEHFDVYIYPIIIPFDEKGALETVLMAAISGHSKEDAYVVEQAKKYVSTVHGSGKTEKYLQHLRDILKAKFSSVISIINPTKSTALFNDLFMLHNWEEKEHIKEQFKLLREIFIP